MARLDNLTREQLKPEDQQFFDEISSSRGSVRGPYGVLLHSPKLAARVAHTGTYVRFDFDIPESLKETVILATVAPVPAPTHPSSMASDTAARQARYPSSGPGLTLWLIRPRSNKMAPETIGTTAGPASIPIPFSSR